MFVDLFNNAALLITLSAFYGIIIKIRKKHPKIFSYISGLWFGGIAILGMMIPFVLKPGIIFDGRSIVLTLSGFFGGGITAIVSMFIAGIYRLFIGGPGVWAGVSTIVVCSLSGLFFRSLYSKRPESINIPAFFVIGISVHILMLLCQLLYPWPNGIGVIKTIGVPVLLVLPIAFILIATIFDSSEKKLTALQSIKDAETLFRATFYSIGDAVITMDNHGMIKQMNPEAERLTGWRETEVKTRFFDECFKIVKEESRPVPESLILKVIASRSSIALADNTMLLRRDGVQIPISESASPITDETGNIIGVVLVFRDETDKRVKQELLERSESRYRELVETTENIAWEYDVLNQEPTYIAPQLIDKTGWLPEEWRNMEFRIEKIHPDDRELMNQHFLDAISQKKTQTAEFRIKNREGNYRWFRDIISVEILRDIPVKLRGIMMDITERKLIELELSEKSVFIEKVLDSLPIGVAINKIDEGQAFYMNHKFEEIYGWSSEEIKDVASFFELVYPDAGYRHEIMTTVMNDINSGDPKKLHWENIIATRKDGTRRIINAVNIPLYEQNIMVSTVMDMTEQVEAEKLLRESEEQFRKLFENHSVVHLLISGQDGIIINANQAAADFYGYSIEELRGLPVSKINIMPAEEIKKAMDDTRLRGKGYFEFKHRLADGRIRDVEIFSNNVELNGKDYLYSVVHDITEKKELFREVVKAKEKAEENDRLKSAFLANMSHEIRTPLNGILGFTGLLIGEKEYSDKEKEKFGRIINKSAESLMQIINDILDLSKLETDQLTLYKVSFRLNENLSGLFGLFRKKLDDKGKNSIKLELKCTPDNLYLNQDGNRLNQIFINLLDNAIKFTTEGIITFGFLEIRDGKIFFTVSDTGIGISQEKHDLIFNRFVQAEDNISKIYGGSGLGLSIVKKLITIMGGDIYLESEKGKGTRFIFYLPFEIGEPAKPDNRGIYNIDERGKTYKILLVEDDQVSIQMYREMIGNQGENLKVAHTGQEALNLFRSFRPEIILMDIGLPDMNGLDVVKAIRKEDRQVYIIAQTAYAMHSDELLAIEAGCNYYISKPVDRNELLKKLFK